MNSTMSKPNEMCVPLNAPHFPDVGVIGLVHEDWREVWQARHHVLTRLAKYFNVVWFGPMRGRQELWRRRSHIDTKPDSCGEAGPGFAVYHQDIWLPKLSRPRLRLLARFTAQQQLRRARSILRKHGSKKTILYLWRPKLASALDMIGCDLSAYHIDDEYTFSRDEKPLNDTEARLISRVDQVFIHSPALLEKKGNLNPHTLFVPNGVDYRAYATPVAEPVDLKPIPHPRIGYVGRIKWQLDTVLLLELAERYPKWAFVMVGPVVGLRDRAEIIQRFAQLPNVYFLGSKPVHELPAYSQHLDVCMLCYELNGYTKFIYPMKLHEYLATGRPVVASPIRTLQDFRGVITLARTVDEWSDALEGSLSPSANTAEQVEVRRKVAQEFDWDALVRLIAHTLCERLGPNYLARFMESQDHKL